MAINTSNTTLYYSTNGSTYNKLVDIVSYPDMGSAPSKLDTTDLTATTYKSQIFGLQELPDLTFDCNYDETALGTINGLTASDYYLRLTFGSADGKFEWHGQIRGFANGGGVDEVRKMTVVTSCTTGITFATT